MRFSCNRFAIIPVTCHKCRMYIWMEPYRRQEFWTGNRYIKRAICKKCIKEFINEYY